MAGSMFGRYEIRRLLGVGGMGEVYEAYDTSKNRVVALKMLNRELAVDPTFVQRFRRESQAMASVQEPHVIPVHDWGEVDGVLYIDMRLVKGVDLKERLQQYGALTPVEAVQVVEQIAFALDAAHEVGLVHRDVKPGNILLTGNLFAYLVDFGIAHTATDTQLTSAGSAVGSMAYMAPERFDNVPMSPSVDTYALTCVLYESLVGRVPFPVNSLAGAIGSHQMAPAPRPSAADPSLTSFDPVIERGMAKRPDQRYASPVDLARAARAALVQAERSTPATVAGPRIEITGPQTPPRREPDAPRSAPITRDSAALSADQVSPQANRGSGEVVDPSAPPTTRGSAAVPAHSPSQTVRGPAVVPAKSPTAAGPHSSPRVASALPAEPHSTRRVTASGTMGASRMRGHEPAGPRPVHRVAGPDPIGGHPSAPVPRPPQRDSATPILAGALGSLIVLAAVGIGVWFMLDAGDDRAGPVPTPPASDVAEPPVIETVQQTVPTTAPSPTATTVPPLQSSVFGADGQGFLTEGPRCNDNDAAMSVARTTKSRVVICHTGDQRYYYKGVRASDGAGIELDDPVPQGGGAYTVTNPVDGTRYELDASGLTITKAGSVLADEPVTEFAHR